MRLIRLRLRDFRGVADATVEFGDGVTVVEGPNEAGKSSLVEALRLVRNKKYLATSKDKAIVAVKPVDRDAGPDVEVELRTGPYRLVHRKRWLKTPRCELTVTTPRPEQHTGREAHERFAQILTETVDLDLLPALDVAQGTSLDRPALGQIPALLGALETAPDESEGHTDLMTRVAEEFKHYFTAGKRSMPTGDYKRATSGIDALEVAVAELSARSKEMDQLTERRAELDHQAKELAQREEAARADLAECQRRADAAADLARAVDTCREHVRTAESILNEARTNQEARAAMVAEADRREQQMAAAIKKTTSLAATCEQAAATLAAADETVKQADGEAEQARESAAAAEAAARHHRDRVLRDDLSHRVTGAREAQSRRQAAEQQVARSRVQAKDLDRVITLAATSTATGDALRIGLERSTAQMERCERQITEREAEARRLAVESEHAAAAQKLADEAVLRATRALAAAQDDIGRHDTLARLSNDVHIAAVARASAATRIVVHRLGDAAVEVDGEQLSEGERRDRLAFHRAQISVPGVIDVEVSPGRSPVELDEALASAASALAEALRDIGAEAPHDVMSPPADDGAGDLASARAEVARLADGEQPGGDGATVVLAWVKTRGERARRVHDEADAALTAAKSERDRAHRTSLESLAAHQQAEAQAQVSREERHRL
ncbi:MAG: AAA family ATPase, partial [Bifidobacteriaceae bacterium]|nr:AAA family ATPase [Bifidobacteriaceae bacterium]